MLSKKEIKKKITEENKRGNGRPKWGSKPFLFISPCAPLVCAEVIILTKNKTLY